MKYMELSPTDRDILIHSLEKMPQYLNDNFVLLSEEAAKERGGDGGFSPVEHVWHLTDLEKEGFAFRIDQLLNNNTPLLPDFKGGEVAQERQYRKLSICEGLKVFKAARLANLAKIKGITDEQWQYSGELEGVGQISLCDIPSLIAQHDAAHQEEIAHWKRQYA